MSREYWTIYDTDDVIDNLREEIQRVHQERERLRERRDTVITERAEERVITGIIKKKKSKKKKVDHFEQENDLFEIE